MTQTAPPKPIEGQPCNGCGFCCAAERCLIAVEVIGPGPAPCPAMEFEDGRFWCGILRNVSHYRPDLPKYADIIFRKELARYFGTGCDSTDWENEG